MKKLLITTLFLSSLLAINLAAMADEEKKGYLGIEVQRNHLSVDTKNIDLVVDSYKPRSGDIYNLKPYSPGIFVGTNFSNHLALEVNYAYIDSDENDSGAIADTKTNIRMHNLGIDLKPFVNVGIVKLYGLVGANAVKANVTERYSAVGISHKESEEHVGFGYSLGAGVEVAILEDVALRVQGKYTKLDMGFKDNNTLAIKSIDNIATVSAGILFKF